MRYLYVSRDMRWWETSDDVCIDGRCAMAAKVTQEDSDGVRRIYHRIDAALWVHLRTIHPADCLAGIRERLVSLYGEAGVAASESTTRAA